MSTGNPATTGNVDEAQERLCGGNGPGARSAERQALPKGMLGVVVPARLVVAAVSVLVALLAACSSALAAGRLPVGSINAFPVPTANSQVFGIAAGTDGNEWFAEFNADKIGRITPAGQITEFPIPTANSGPSGIAAGPDGNMWFTEGIGAIGRITPAGQITEFPVPTVLSVPGRDRSRGGREHVVRRVEWATESGGSHPPGRSPSS